MKYFMLILLGILLHVVRAVLLSAATVMWYVIITDGHMREHTYHLITGIALLYFIFIKPRGLGSK